MVIGCLHRAAENGNAGGCCAQGELGDDFLESSFIHVPTLHASFLMNVCKPNSLSLIIV
jgi:hypothetical protein